MADPEIERRDKIILALQSENDELWRRLREIGNISGMKEELLGKVVKPFDAVEFEMKESRVDHPF